jgi:predicted  nucleic acid-binding Zn-ribbon protein
MHPSIKHLIELQTMDLRLNELRALVASFPKRLAESDARVEAARKQLAAAK